MHRVPGLTLREDINHIYLMNFASRIKTEKENVLSFFVKHEAERIPYDFFAIKIIGKLHDSNFDFYSVVLQAEELKNIILPHHKHDSDIVPDGGMPLLDCCEVFRKSTNRASAECLRKVDEIKGKMQLIISNPINSFILLSSDKEVVHPKHYNNFSNDSLFIANGFHRLLALGLIFFENGTIPLKSIYYCESAIIPRK